MSIHPEIQTVFVDMDGVLVDFVGGVLKSHSLPLSTIKRFEGAYDIAAVLNMKPRDFWRHLDEDRRFWAELEPTPECFEIMARLESYFDRKDIYLLSSPAISPDCFSGKAEWVAAHLPTYMNRLFLMNKKHFCAAPGRLLIDDSDTNVAKFKSAGGAAVLLPRPWNSRHAELRNKTTISIFEKEINYRHF